MYVYYTAREIGGLRLESNSHYINYFFSAEHVIYREREKRFSYLIRELSEQTVGGES